MYVKKVVVGSKNPVKLETTKQAFAEVFKDEEFEFFSYDSVSSVSAQPFGTEETKLGARNRAQNCLSEFPEADYFVGHEGGIEIIDNEYWSSAWMCVMNKDGKIGYGRAPAFQLPPQLIELIKEGKELGHATDEVFGVENSKQAGSTISFLTNGSVNRIRFYRQAVIFALIPFIQTELY